MTLIINALKNEFFQFDTELTKLGYCVECKSYKEIGGSVEVELRISKKREDVRASNVLGYPPKTERSNDIGRKS